MIGARQLQLGAEQMISGMSSSDFATDGALGVSSRGLNPFVIPGTIRPLSGATDVSANLSGNLVATSGDSQTVAPSVRVGIDDAGNIYSWGGSSWTKQITGLTNTYSFPETDMVPFYTSNYATCNGTHLMQINTSAWTKTENFKALQDGSALHPLLVYQSNLYIGDGKHLPTLQSDESTYNTDSAWVLNGNEKIVALAIDPLTGLMLVSVQTAYNKTDTLQQQGIVYLYDGISAKPTRKIIVDDLITSFYQIEGSVYVGTGSGVIGMWNGNGITFLRRLKTNGTFTFTDLPYKQHFANTGNIMHVVDGASVLSYGSVVSGKKGFFYTAVPLNNVTDHLGIIMSLGSYKLGIGYATIKAVSYDFSSLATPTAATVNLFFNNIYFPRPVFIRRVRVITTGITTNVGAGTFTLTDEKGVTYSTANPFYIVLAAASPQYVFDFDYSSVKLQGLQINSKVDTQNWGFVRFIVYYDIAE